MKKRNPYKGSLLWRGESARSKGRRLWALVIATLAVALLAGACGDDDAEPADSGAADPGADTATAEPEDTADEPADAGADDSGAADSGADAATADDTATAEPEDTADEPADSDAADSDAADSGADDSDAADSGEADSGAEEVTAAFILVGPVGDAGWNWAHDQGRQYAESETGAHTLYVESVPENAEEFRAVATDYIENEGAGVIFGTSFGYMDPMLELAAEYPDVVFEHASGYKMNDTNFGNYFGRMYQPRYLSGLAAGAMSQSGNIGYVAAFPIPEVLRGINAFTLGVRETNPSAEVHVNWTFTWFDPAVEGDTAEALLEAGADVIAMHQDSTAAGIAAQNAGARWVAYNSDMSQFAPDAFLTAPVWNWGPRYAAIIESVAAGSYAPGSYWGGMDDGIVGLAPLADDVPAEVADAINAAADSIRSGEWDVFTGEIRGQDGSVKVAAGETLDDGSMLGMDWFVEGVVGDASP